MTRAQWRTLHWRWALHTAALCVAGLAAVLFPALR